MNNSLKRTFDGEGFVRNVLPPTRSLMRTDCRHETLFQKPLTSSKYFKSSSLDTETHLESKPLEQKFNRVPCCARNMRCDHNLKVSNRHHLLFKCYMNAAISSLILLFFEDGLL